MSSSTEENHFVIDIESLRPEINEERKNIIERNICGMTLLQTVVINSENDCPTKCLKGIYLFLSILFIIAYIASWIAFYIFCAFSLDKTSYTEQKDLCPESNAWVFVISMLIYLCLECVTTPLQNNNIAKNIQLSMACLFAVWSVREFFFVSCVSNLSNTYLHTVLLIDMVLAFFSTLIYLFFFLQRSMQLVQNT